MTILGRDLGNEFRQFVPSPGWAQDNAAVTVEGQRHRVSLTEAGLLGDRQRNPDSQAVPPFRNRGFILHVYLL